MLLATINAMGGVAAAVCTLDVIKTWHPKHVILIGVAGADPADPEVALGDVVVSERVVGYEVSKLTDDDGQEGRPHTWFPGDILNGAVTRASGAWRRTAWAGVVINGNVVEPPSGGQRRPEIQRVAIGSGNKLVASKVAFEKIQTQYPLIKAVEMEADGVGYACSQSEARMLVIKGIMDRSERKSRGSRRKDAWKRYAALVSAMFAEYVVREL